MTENSISFFVLFPPFPCVNFGRVNFCTCHLHVCDFPCPACCPSLPPCSPPDSSIKNTTHNQLLSALWLLFFVVVWAPVDTCVWLCVCARIDGVHHGVRFTRAHTAIFFTRLFFILLLRTLDWTTKQLYSLTPTTGHRIRLPQEHSTTLWLVFTANRELPPLPLLKLIKPQFPVPPCTRFPHCLSAGTRFSIFQTPRCCSCCAIMLRGKV